MKMSLADQAKMIKLKQLQPVLPSRTKLPAAQSRGSAKFVNTISSQTQKQRGRGSSSMEARDKVESRISTRQVIQNRIDTPNYDEMPHERKPTVGNTKMEKQNLPSHLNETFGINQVERSQNKTEQAIFLYSSKPQPTINAKEIIQKTNQTVKS